MSINSTPRFSDIPPLQRHFLYGVNCYQYALGFEPVTIFTNAANPSRFAYLTLCPGHFAENVLNAGGVGIAPYVFKKMIREGCQEDGLIELEQRSLSHPINVPEGMRLISLHIAEGDDTGPGDFDFSTHNPKSNQWENKTPFEDVKSHDHLSAMLSGGYTFHRLFLAKEKMVPLGVPAGQMMSCENNLILNFVESQPYWARGPVLRNHGDDLFLRKGTPLYAKPSWPEPTAV